MSAKPILETHQYPLEHGDYSPAKAVGGENDFDIFRRRSDGVDFRTVGWPRASVISLKILFATGDLLPSAMYEAYLA
jgi:hypothetical protein